MKVIILILACSLIALVTPVRAANQAPTTRPSLEEENSQLRKEVAKLREQLYDKDLELNRLRLKQSLSALQPGVDVPVVPPPLNLTPAVPPADMPKGAVPQRFNGSTFYLVPLSETAIVTGTPRMITVDHQEFVPATIESRPVGTIDDRSGATRNLIHGK